MGFKSWFDADRMDARIAAADESQSRAAKGLIFWAVAAVILVAVLMLI